MVLSQQERNRAYDERNREKRAAAARARRMADPEKQRAIKRKCYLKHAQANRAYASAWRAANPDKVREHEQQRDKDRQRARARQWKLDNPERAKEHARRRLASPEGKLANRLRARINECLRKGRHSRGFVRVTGYTIAELKVHLERQFTRGMGWHNMGDWHIDHIVPLAAFRPGEAARAWALTNLRPLWASENMAKNAKVLTLL